MTPNKNIVNQVFVFLMEDEEVCVRDHVGHTHSLYAKYTCLPLCLYVFPSFFYSNHTLYFLFTPSPYKPSLFSPPQNQPLNSLSLSKTQTKIQTLHSQKKKKKKTQIIETKV